LAKSLANPDKSFKKKKRKKMEILSGFASDLARISGDPQRPPAEGLRGGLLTISAVTTLLVYTVHYF
jgi:hypothetical protein